MMVILPSSLTPVGATDQHVIDSVGKCAREDGGGSGAPALTIIVPVHNTAKYLARCVESILDQKFKDFELLLVDDGSQDDSGAMCDGYAEADARVKVIHQENGGAAAARNAGLDVAAGAYVGFIDSDDFIDDDMYEVLIRNADASGADIVVCGRYVLTGETATPLFTMPRVEAWTAEKALGNLLTWSNIDSAPCDKVFRAHLFKELRFPVGRHVEDIFVVPLALARANTVIHVGEAKYFYRQLQTSVSHQAFSLRKMDLLEAADGLRDFVGATFPELMPQAESFRFKAVLHLMSMLYADNSRAAYREAHSRLAWTLRKELWLVMRSRFLRGTEKGAAVLLAFGLYGPAKVGWRILKPVAHSVWRKGSPS